MIPNYYDNGSSYLFYVNGSFLGPTNEGIKWDKWVIIGPKNTKILFPKEHVMTDILKEIIDFF